MNNVSIVSTFVNGKSTGTYVFIGENHIKDGSAFMLTWKQQKLIHYVDSPEGVLFYKQGRPSLKADFDTIRKFKEQVDLPTMLDLYNKYCWTFRLQISHTLGILIDKRVT